MSGTIARLGTIVVVTSLTLSSIGAAASVADVLVVSFAAASLIVGFAISPLINRHNQAENAGPARLSVIV